MKKNLIYLAAFCLIAWSVTSCEVQKCKFCKNVTYENGSVIIDGTETEFCGAALIVKEATADIVVGNLTTKVECR